ncbi:cell division protein FtsQ/DivIB [Tessaracoccus sp. Z1128]
MTEALPPGEFAKALQHKRLSDRRRRWILRGSLIGAVVLLLLGGWLAYFSPVFETRAVVVEGTVLLTTEEVAAAAAVEMGIPLMRQDVAAITERVRALAPVREARVSRRAPDTVAVVVTEREVAFQRQRDGQWDWVDAEGVPFHRTAEPHGAAIQVTSSSTDERLLRDVAVVAGRVPDELRPEVVRMTAEAVDRITLTLDGGRTLVWGSAEESELKSEVASALVSSVDAKVYDVSAPRHPTTR